LSGAGRIEEAKQALVEVLRNYRFDDFKSQASYGSFRGRSGSDGRKSSKDRLTGLILIFAAFLGAKSIDSIGRSWGVIADTSPHLQS
jgi:hypothetical protein